MLHNATAASTPDIEAEIYGYLDKRFPALAPVSPDTALLDGAIDSLGFLELIMFLGERFNLSMEDDNFDFQELATPASLVNFVSRARM
jgi:acyl carrier protein